MVDPKMCRNSVAGRSIISAACAFWSLNALAGAAGPSVGNPNANEASEDPEPKSTMTSRRIGEPLSSATKYYTVVEGRHVISDYVNKDEVRIRRDAAVHGKLQIGVRLYGDRLDLSAAGGAVKLPASQAIFQKRPEIVADVYAIKSQYVNVLWYNMLQVPVRESDRDPTEYNDTDLYDRDALRGIDASVFTVGLAPVIKTEWRMFGGKYMARMGADGWTKFYSKPLYVDESNDSEGGGVGLIAKGTAPDEKPFEDRAMRYVHQESVALGWTPSMAPALLLDLGAHIETRYIPQYYRGETGGWDYTYLPERRSFWRAKVNFDLNQTWSIQDEVYFFRNGFFAENRVNDDRRLKNTVRLTAKL
ncbi:MAG: hypothetical protein NTV34_18140 [Proteobacteria bacterium]|nr:hypothetical protein [Pseudomonadota bacterium]